MITKKNKKGIAYFAMLPVFTILIGIAFALAITIPANKAIFDPEFQLMKSYDKINSFSPVEKVFIETYINNVLKSSPNEYANSKVKLNLNSEMEINYDGYLGCNYNKEPLWYNEKNKESEKNKDHVDCLGLTSDFSSGYTAFLEKKIQNGIEPFLTQNNIKITELKFSKDNLGNLNLNLKTTNDFSNDLGEISKSNNYKFTTNDSKYSNLVSQIHSILPQLSSKIGSDIMSCLNDEKTNYNGKDLELCCINKIFYSMLDSDLKSNYDFSITRLENNKVSDYLGLKFEIKEKKTKILQLEFSAIFENKIPLGVVDYDLTNYESITKPTIKVTITKTENNVIPNKFVILYSYENFLDKNYKKYNDLLTLLRDSNLRSNSEKIDISTEDKYYYLKDPEYHLSFIVTDSDKFKEDGKKEVYLYQIYNSETNAFEFLQSNKKIYTIVFAVSSNYNYYTDENLLRNNEKSIDVKSSLGSKPINGGDFSVIPNLQGFDQSFGLKITSYVDPNFKQFNLYIMEKQDGVKFTKNCDGVSNCEMYPFSPVKENNAGNYFVTSDSTINEVSGYDELIKLKKLKLESGKTYEVLLVPVDDIGNGAILSYDLKYSFIENMAGEVKFYNKVSNIQDGIRPIEKDITILDSKSPTSDSITYSSITQNGNDLTLDWQPKAGTDVVSVYIEGTELLANGGKSYFSSILTSDNKIVFTKTTETQSIQITHMYPRDAAGNPKDVTVNDNRYALQVPLIWP